MSHGEPKVPSAYGNRMKIMKSLAVPGLHPRDGGAGVPGDSVAAGGRDVLRCSGGLRAADGVSGLLGAVGHLHVQLRRCLGQLQEVHQERLLRGRVGRGRGWKGGNWEGVEEGYGRLGCCLGDVGGNHQGFFQELGA